MQRDIDFMDWRQGSGALPQTPPGRACTPRTPRQASADAPGGAPGPATAGSAEAVATAGAEHVYASQEGVWAAELRTAQSNRGRSRSIGIAGSDGEGGTSPSASESARDVGSGECTHAPAGFGAEPHWPRAEFAPRMFKLRGVSLKRVSSGELFRPGQVPQNTCLHFSPRWQARPRAKRSGEGK